jgi:hypothetical protein
MHDFCGGSINLLGPKNLPHLCTNDILISNQNPTSEVERRLWYTQRLGNTIIVLLDQTT